MGALRPQPAGLTARLAAAGLVLALIAAAVASGACGGKLGPDNGGVQCGAVIAPGGDDGCRSAEMSCAGGRDRCADYVDGVDDPFASSQTGDATQSVSDGVLHFKASAGSSIFHGAIGKDSGSFAFTARLKTGLTTNGITVVRVRLPLAGLEDAAIELVLRDGRLLLCPWGGGSECKTVGVFSPQRWHSIRLSLEGLKLIAVLDCGAVAAVYQPPTELDKAVISAIDFGIVEAPCAAEVDIDLARSD